MIVHLVAGLGTIGFVFPALDAQARRARIRRWSRKLLGILHVELRLAGALAHPNVVVVANHVSWLDIFALHAVGPVRFIAKSEIAHWPVLGRLVAGVGTRIASTGTSRRRWPAATSSRSFRKAR